MDQSMFFKITVRIYHHQNENLNGGLTGLVRNSRMESSWLGRKGSQELAGALEVLCVVKAYF